MITTTIPPRHSRTLITKQTLKPEISQILALSLLAQTPAAEPRSPIARNQYKDITNNAGGDIQNLNNNNTFCTITGENNEGTITNISNTTNGTIDSISNQGHIKDGTNDGHIKGFVNAKPNAQIDEGKLDTFTNNKQIDSFDNQGGSVGTFTNAQNATITQFTNSAQGNIDTLSNNGTLVGFTNAVDGQVDTFTNAGSVTNMAQNSGSITSLVNSGSFDNGLTNNNDGSITRLDHRTGATLDTLNNQGVISTVGLGAVIKDYTSNNTGNATDLYVLGTKDDVYITKLTNNAGTINIKAQGDVFDANNNSTGTLYIRGATNAQGGIEYGELHNTGGTISGSTIDIWGETFDNTGGTINAKQIIWGRDISANNYANATPINVNNNGVHIDGTISNATDITLTNWVLKLDQTGGPTAAGGTYNDFNQSGGANANGHIILGNNVNPNEIAFTPHKNPDGSTNANGGVLIIADTTKWGQKYNYTSLFVQKQADGSYSTALKEIKNTSGDIVNKTDEWGEGEGTLGKAENLGGQTTLQIEADKHLFTMQPTVDIHDLLDGFSIGIRPQRNPGEDVSKTLLNGVITKNIIVSNLMDSMSKRLFHQSLRHKKGKTYTVTSKSVDTDGNRVKDDNDMEVALRYSNVDLLHETDMIYAPHAEDARKQTFIMPLTRYTRTDLGDGDIGVEYAGGALAGGFAHLGAFGTMGLYVGYEYASSFLPRPTGSANITNQSILAGLQYYHSFFTHRMNELYMKVIVHAQMQKPELELTLTNPYNAATQQTLSAYGADAEIRFGGNFYNIFNNSYISPEIGIGYGIMKLEAFSLDYNSNVIIPEHYPEHTFLTPYATGQLKYTKAFRNKARYSVALGARYTINNEQKTTLEIGSGSASSFFKLPRVIGTSSAGIFYSVGKSSEISAQIDALFAQEQLTGALSFKYALWF
ncbi:hypothetical protein [uncultured Helicobacter sp.]|uniref:hypothetical protein n=2 Tax=uncultured Helicobacter sp. TaxID=175537 RepID=UPI00262DFC49|nr:hypothetical protein [uncultured Helicobacter sp.]